MNDDVARATAPMAKFRYQADSKAVWGTPDRWAIVDRTISTSEQIMRGKLAERMLTEKEGNLSAPELKTIEDQIAKAGLSPIAVYEAIKILDPALAAK